MFWAKKDNLNFDRYLANSKLYISNKCSIHTKHLKDKLYENSNN